VESIQQKQDQIIEEFDFFQDWSEKYQHLIDLGKTLPEFDENNKIDSNLIKGCQSKVWLNSSFNDNMVIFEADSDAIISKGIISLLVKVFSGHKPDEIIEANIDFIEKIGLDSHLSQTRANGLLSMIKQIKIYALAYKAKQ
jgi:cysteine desulfuration protein SufE